VCNNLYGLQDIQILSKTEILAIFNVRHPAFPDDNKIFHLNVFLDPVSGSVEEAEVCASKRAIHRLEAGINNMHSSLLTRKLRSKIL
jgi:hypothetical protein